LILAQDKQSDQRSTISPPATNRHTEVQTRDCKNVTQRSLRLGARR